jgi:hypothetical protein
MIRINQCAADVPLEARLQKLATPDVPFISISSEGEMWQARYTHQPDRFSRRGGNVTYEVAGASHRAGDVPGLAPDRISFAPIPDTIKAGMQMPGGSSAPNLIPPGAKPNDFIWQPLVRGAFRNLEAWVTRGIRPRWQQELPSTRNTKSGATPTAMRLADCGCPISTPPRPRTPAT